MKTVFEYKRGYRKSKKELKKAFETLHCAKKWMVLDFVNL